MTVTESIALPALERLDDAGRALLFTDARTANSFAPTPVTDAELNEIWELAKWPPTAANVQPLRVLYVRPGPGRDRLVEHMADGNKAKTASAPAVAVLALDTRFHEHIPAIIPYKPELKDVFEANETMRTETGRFSAARPAGYFLLAGRARARPPARPAAPSPPPSPPAAAGAPSWSSPSAPPGNPPGSAACPASIS